MSQSPSRRSRSPGPARYSPRRSYSRSLSPERRGRSSYSPDGRGNEQVSTIYVGGISFDTDERALQNYFEKFGVVLETKVVMDRETQRSKGYGFVKFEDPRDAHDAISGCNGKLLDGRTIRCNMAKYNPGQGGPAGGFGPPMHDGYGGPRGPPPGRGYGGRGYGGRGFQDDGFYGGRGRGGGRYENGGRGGGRFGYMGGRGGPPPGIHPSERGMVNERRSDSPGRGPPKRRRSVSGSPGAGRDSRHKHRRGPHSGRRSRKHSRSRSFSSSSSYSRSVSRSGSRSPSRRTAAAGEASAQELVAAKQRVAELESRIAALEAQTQAAGTARGALTDELADMQQAQQKAEATHKLYRRWMSALLDSSQKLLIGKEAVVAAEAELAQRHRDLASLLVEAEGFLAQERKSRKAARKAELGLNAAEEGAVPPGAELEARHAEPVAANGTAPPPPTDEINEGGWQEASADPTADPPSAKFAPGAKFTIDA